MMEIKIKIIGDKIVTNISTEELTLIEASMISYELQRIILHLADMEWEGEDNFEMKSDDDGD